MNSSLSKILFFSLIIFAFSCNDDPIENPVLTDSFDRSEMLQFWADDIIIPAYTSYNNMLEVFNDEVLEFFEEPSIENLDKLRTTWLNAYLAWQEVSMFEIGKAEEIGLRNFTNIYPADVELIHANINGANYNLELPSNFPAQGFPALDYLLFGLENNDAENLEALLNDEVEVYLKDLVNRLNDLASTVLDDWNENYRDAFISNSGSSANSSTDKMVNDFLFYYEKFLRAAKVGIPAGIFSGSEEPELVEGRYSDIYSKMLFQNGFTAVKIFFTGQSYDGLRQGTSLKQYLTEIYETNDVDFDIAATITSQWDKVDLALEDVGASYQSQIREDNAKMLALYDELQKAVVPLKVDMLQALNIQVDFVDADGD